MSVPRNPSVPDGYTPVQILFSLPYPILPETADSDPHPGYLPSIRPETEYPGIGRNALHGDNKILPSKPIYQIHTIRINQWYKIQGIFFKQPLGYSSSYIRSSAYASNSRSTNFKSTGVVMPHWHEREALYPTSTGPFPNCSDHRGVPITLLPIVPTCR